MGWVGVYIIFYYFKHPVKGVLPAEWLDGGSGGGRGEGGVSGGAPQLTDLKLLSEE